MEQKLPRAIMVVVSVVIFIIAVSIVGYYLMQSSTIVTTLEASLTTTPKQVFVKPTIDETSVLETVIAKYIAQKGSSDENSIIISVSTIEGNYAKGIISFKDEMGGGLWFAAKEGNAWKLVWDGNGIIKCSDLALYPEFSKTLIPECFDDATQNMKER